MERSTTTLPAPDLATPEAALARNEGDAMELLTALGVLQARSGCSTARDRIDILLGDLRTLIEYAVAVARG